MSASQHSRQPRQPSIHHQQGAFVKQGTDIDEADLELKALRQEYQRNKELLDKANQQGYPEHEKANASQGMKENYDQIKGRVIMLSAQIGAIERFKELKAQEFLTNRENTRLSNNEIKAKRITEEWKGVVRYR